MVPDDADNNDMTKAGFVALIGAPNAGKSTLMNAMVGQKVSIVTPKVQTTRSRVRGIAMHENVQIIFVDTPGIFKPKRRLDRAMVQAAWQGAEDGDVLLLLHDCARRVIDDDTASILANLAKSGRKASLVLNKIDLAPQQRLLERAAQLSEQYDFERVFMVSAESGNGVADLKAWLAAQMPKSPFLFDPDDLSDMPLRLLAAETLREKLFLNLHQELPYQLTVETNLPRPVKSARKRRHRRKSRPQRQSIKRPRKRPQNGLPPRPQKRPQKSLPKHLQKNLPVARLASHERRYRNKGW